jgi:transposase-like protein
MSNPYPEQFKEAAVRRYLSSDLSYRELGRELGIPGESIRPWVRRAKQLGTMAKSGRGGKKRSAVSTEQRPAEEKLRLLLEARSLSEEQHGEFLRREGLRDADLERWSEEALAGLGGELHNELDVRRIGELERQQVKQSKQLRETKALLELSKKVAALWEDEDDDIPQG